MLIYNMFAAVPIACGGLEILVKVVVTVVAESLSILEEVVESTLASCEVLFGSSIECSDKIFVAPLSLYWRDFFILISMIASLSNEDIDIN